MPSDYKFIRVCGVKVHIIRIPEIISFIEDRIKERGAASYIVTTNANTIVKAKNDPSVSEAVNNGTLSIADGYSLVFFSRFYGEALNERAYGPDLMLDFMKVSEDKGYSNFFYGSTAKTLEQLLKNLKNRFPRLNVAGAYSPPFSDYVQSDESGARAINESGADIVWVSLGGVKQERWMFEHKNKINVPVMVGVGAAFDFISGVKPQAPLWLRNNGFEWLFRLATEPGRLWRRYLMNNILFVYYVGIDLFSKRYRYR